MIKISYQKRTKLRGIYAIKNIINNKLYIGSSKHIMLRIFGGGNTGHIKSLNNNIHINYHLQAAWNKYGSENFEYYIIELCDESINLFDKEDEYLISILKADELPKNKYFYKYGYNLCPTSRSVARKKHTNKTKKKFSDSKKGKLNPMWGRTGDNSPYSLELLQYDLKGNFVKEWKSTRSASEETGIHMGNIATSAQSNKKGEITRTANRFYWIYKNEEIIKPHIITNNNFPHKKILIEILDITTNKIYTFINYKDCIHFMGYISFRLKEFYIKNKLVKKKFKILKYE